MESSEILRYSIGFLVILGVPIYYMVTFYELQVVQLGGSNTYEEESSSMNLFIIGGMFLHIILGINHFYLHSISTFTQYTSSGTQMYTRIVAGRKSPAHKLLTSGKPPAEF